MFGLHKPSANDLNKRLNDGASLQQIADAAKAASDRASIELCLSDEAWQCVLLFGKSATQWRKGLGGLEGLNYDGVATVAKLSNIELNEDMFRMIQIMESAVLAEVARVRDS